MSLLLLAYFKYAFAYLKSIRYTILFNFSTLQLNRLKYISLLQLQYEKRLSFIWVFDVKVSFKLISTFSRSFVNLYTYIYMQINNCVFFIVFSLYLLLLDSISNFNRSLLGLLFFGDCSNETRIRSFIFFSIRMWIYIKTTLINPPMNEIRNKFENLLKCAHI